MLDDYLPIVKATINETCTLVAAARVRSDRISIPTNKNYIFSKRYGKKRRTEDYISGWCHGGDIKFKSSGNLLWKNLFYFTLEEFMKKKTFLLRPNLTTMLRGKRPHKMYDIFITNILRE